MSRSVFDRTFVALALAGALGGCSHTFFQFHIDRAQQNEIMTARNTLTVSAQGDLNTLAQVVDLNGRRAVETLLAGMTVERTEADPQFQRLVRGLYLGIMSDGESPLTALDSDLGAIALRAGQRAAANGLSQMGLGGIAAMVGVVGDDSGQRLREMQGSLIHGGAGTCTQLVPIISYDAAILGHIHSQVAEQDATYLDWRRRVRAIHLVRFGCPNGQMLMLLTKNAGEPGVRVLGWHFVTAEEWTALDPRLRQALDLP